ncbi:hypothetical protein TWF730_000694 [Orbilia blumenaviensis]|uniref:Uncharacterized protein n=1 Tax=Orbilia blumenaviensis TaxID=1796055 RepID=A0AAV9VQH6_9PEZI
MYIRDQVSIYQIAHQLPPRRGDIIQEQEERKRKTNKNETEKKTNYMQSLNCKSGHDKKRRSDVKRKGRKKRIDDQEENAGILQNPTAFYILSDGEKPGL